MRCGVDLVEVARVRKAVERQGEGFLTRVYTPGEIAYCEARGTGRFQSYAARLAAKEAAAKALGTGIAGGVSFREIEVVCGERGEPQLELHGRTAEVAGGLRVKGRAISLSHTADHAMALVVLELDDFASPGSAPEAPPRS